MRTLTEMYNDLEALRAGRSLSPREGNIKGRALILILRELHDELDAAVLRAYGWPQGLTDEDILTRLVALNKERAAEEASGHVRWLRPDYQIPRFGSATQKAQKGQLDLVAPADKAKPSVRSPPGTLPPVGARASASRRRLHRRCGLSCASAIWPVSTGAGASPCGKWLRDKRKRGPRAPRDD